MDKQRIDIFLRGFLVIVTTTLLSAVCFIYFDQIAALWFLQHHYISPNYLQKVSVIPSFFEAAALIVYVIYFLSWLFSFSNKTLTQFLNISNCIVITYLFKVWAKFVFGRLLPMVSMSTNDYGFHFFHGGDAYIAFPSGHSAIAVTTLTALALNYRVLGIPALLLSIAVPISLVLQGFHFISDTIAGAGLGCVIAYWYHAITAEEDVEKQLMLLAD